MYLVCCYEVNKFLKSLKILRTNTCKDRGGKIKGFIFSKFMCFENLSVHKVVSARMPKVSSFQKNANEDRIALLQNLYFHGKFLQLQKCRVDIK